MSEVKSSRWRHDAGACKWWQTFHGGSELEDGSWNAARFRKRFRVPRSIFDELLALTRASGLFPENTPGDGSCGPRTHPLELKLMATLYWMGHGVDFFTVEEIANIDQEVIRTWSLQWLKWAAKTLVPKHIRVP